LTERKPFAHLWSPEVVVVYVAKGGHPKRGNYSNVNDDIWGMLVNCWDLNPNQRPSMAALTRFFAAQWISQSLQNVRQLAGRIVQDLAGGVRRIDGPHIAHGEFANIWKAAWTPMHSLMHSQRTELV
jgi:hypothetical protein